MKRTVPGRSGGNPGFCRKLALAAAFFLSCCAASAASAQTSFYDAPTSRLAGQPGTLVRQEIIDGAPLGATAYRVLYRSTGITGEPIFVSGVVVVNIDPASDAAAKSLQRGDIISSVNRVAVSTPAQFDAQVRAAKAAGRTSVLVYVTRARQGSLYIALKFKN